MRAGPPQAIRAIVALLIPPACKEEVLGDLEERFLSTPHYLRDALHALPCIILSKIRRTADPHLLLMHAFVLYLSYFAAAWFLDLPLLEESWGLARLAFPAALTLLALVLEDAYAKPGARSPLRLVRGPVLGLAWALLSQAALWAGHSTLALPLWIALSGGSLALLLTSALRMLFSPPSTSRQGPV